MKKILATVAGLVALSLGSAACSAVDKEPTSATPIAASSIKAENFQNEIRQFKASRDAVRPEATPVKTYSTHEIHVMNMKKLAAEKAAAQRIAAAKAKAKAIAHAKYLARVKAERIAAEKAAKRKAEKTAKSVKVKKAVKPKTHSKKVSLAGIAACIAKYESGGNPRAQNPSSSASGLFQFIDGTWNHFGGYARAMYAPVSVQLQKFYIIWNGGRGAHHWVVAPKCGY